MCVSSQEILYYFRVSYLEIYNETMFDLLSTLPESLNATSQNLNVVEDENGVYVKGLSSHVAQTEEEALNLLFEVRTLKIFRIFANATGAYSAQHSPLNLNAINERKSLFKNCRLIFRAKRIVPLLSTH